MMTMFSKRKNLCHPKTKHHKKRTTGTRGDVEGGVERSIREFIALYNLMLTKNTQCLAICLTCNEKYQTNSNKKMMEYLKVLLHHKLYPLYSKIYPNMDYICCKELCENGCYHLHLILMYHSNDRKFFIPQGKLNKKTPEKNTFVEMWGKGAVTIQNINKYNINYLAPHKTNSTDPYAQHMVEKLKRSKALPANVRMYTCSRTNCLNLKLTYKQLEECLEAIGRSDLAIEPKWKTKNFKVNNKSFKKWFPTFFSEWDLSDEDFEKLCQIVKSITQND